MLTMDKLMLDQVNRSPEGAVKGVVSSLGVSFKFCVCVCVLKVIQILFKASKCSHRPTLDHRIGKLELFFTFLHPVRPPSTSPSAGQHSAAMWPCRNPDSQRPLHGECYKVHLKEQFDILGSFMLRLSIPVVC